MIQTREDNQVLLFKYENRVVETGKESGYALVI